MQKLDTQKERLGIFGYMDDEPGFAKAEEYNPAEFLKLNFLGFAEQLPHDLQLKPRVLMSTIPQHREPDFIKPLVFMQPHLLHQGYENSLVIDPCALNAIIQILGHESLTTLIFLWRMLGRFLRLFVHTNAKYAAKETFTQQYKQKLINAAPKLEHLFHEEPDHSTQVSSCMQQDVHINSGLFIGVILGSFDGTTFDAVLARNVLTLKRPEFDADPEKWLRWLRMIEEKFF